MTQESALYGTVPSAVFTAAEIKIQLSPQIPPPNPPPPNSWISDHLETRAPASLDALTMLAPPNTQERRYALALALQALKTGSPLIVLAPKDKGGARLAQELEAFGCLIEETSRRHHRIIHTQKPASFSQNATQALQTALTEGQPRWLPELELWSQPGLFSWDRVDIGSALLLAHLPVLCGKGADLGCGIGVLARHVLKSTAVTQLTAVDYDRRALDLMRRSLPTPRLTPLWADVRQPLALHQLDFVVMNPPFHAGGIEDQSLGQHFIRQAAQMLRPKGRCWITANRHLPYEAVLRQVFQQLTLIASDNGFKIYEAIK